MIYFIQADGIGHVKIGFTDNDDVEYRLAQLQTGSPVLLRLLGTISGTLEDEKTLHRRFASARACGEWFKPVPDLLEMIGPREVRTCEGTTVCIKSVQIQVLTVGRKQFTTSLLKQLREEDFICWAFVTGCIGDEEEEANGLTLDTAAEGDFWGWIKKDDVLLGERIKGIRSSYSQAVWLIFERGGVLCKQHAQYHHQRIPKWNANWIPESPEGEKKAKIVAFWKRFYEHWITEANQLYIGV